MSEMRESAFWVLTALAAGPRHGYGILQEAGALSQGGAVVKATTLYAVLDRLEQDGLIETAGEEVVDGRNRRYYRLTAAGTDRLDAETDKLEARVRAARTQRNIGLRPAAGNHA